jgi:hypothetical protein
MPQYQIYFDTLEGERKYKVEIADDEPLDAVINDILVELTENGHVIKGLADGALKVVWGRAEGQELDLGLTLPEQGVRPNEVLRVLVDKYIGGSIRSDRIDREWRLAARLVDLNPGVVELIEHRRRATSDVFVVALHASPGVTAVDDEQVFQSDDQQLRLEFSRFYPEVPVECYTESPLFHPNVRAETGFVCLWDEAAPQHSVVQAITRAQATAAYRMVNLRAVHVMNKAAAEWYATLGQPSGLVPLASAELRVHEVRDGQVVWLEPGRQLAPSRRRRIE